ncbi:hypothetical protein [Bythopirellula polymerisocia]|uniref:Uncharacterized protein n=1 Tax=Bythopirellula polymerisocia TaxID=2528003 RepID=A0A5C6CXE8_9BACT|nr:hypothetical protein [Bythopirellula polymerisocia]TWU28294.1 hypothetical protein Pla144_15810 [Bythopirellula polymerisocia]
MRRNVLLLLTLTVVTTANVGCCSSFRNWLHRGARCGTRTVAPAMMGSPVALGAPVAAPTMQPMMAAPAMQQMAVPQQQCVPQCAPQCVPCIPMCQPCFDPCANMCCPSDPCSQGSWYGGFSDGDETYMPSSETFVPQGSSNTITPGPAPEVRTNYPEPEKTEE